MSKPENTKALVEASTSNWNSDKACKVSHSITLRFEFDDNNSLDTGLDKIKTLDETLKANPDLDLLIVNHAYDVASQRINMKDGFKRALLMKEKLVEMGVPAAQLETGSKRFDKALMLNTSKKRTRNWK